MATNLKRVPEVVSALEDLDVLRAKSTDQEDVMDDPANPVLADWRRSTD